jgi:hypothetical protein
MSGNATNQELVERRGSDIIVRMLKSRKTILCFAGVGFAVSMVLDVCGEFALRHNFSSGLEVVFDVAYFVLCLPNFLVLFCFDNGCEKSGWDTAAIYVGLAVLNAAIYAIGGKIWISHR